MSELRSDFAPTASWANLHRRAEILALVRQFFAARNFLEVETPLLSHDTIVDRHIEPIGVRLPEDAWHADHGRMLWLQTSPEFSMKRMLASGFQAIYQITRAFRGGAEKGRLHNPEFTILEWYRVADDMQAGMQLLDDFCQAILQRGTAERLTYAEAFQRHLDLDPHRCSTQQLIAAATHHGLHLTPSWKQAARDDWLDWLLVSCVEPHLGMGRPTILFDYPASQAALAKIRDDDVPLAERFELYADGIELANGYHELTDPAILQQRAQQANAARVQAGQSALPTTSRLSTAMQHSFPDSAGVAVGLDRLVLVAVGADSLADVMAFPIDRA